MNTPQYPVQPCAVSAALMQSFRTAEPVSAGLAIATARNDSTGQAEVFSLGTLGTVSRIHTDPGSPSGWASVDLGFPGEATYLAAAGEPGGRLTVYAADTTNTLHVLHLGATSGGAAPAWEKLPPLLFLITGVKVGYTADGTHFLVAAQRDSWGKALLTLWSNGAWVALGESWGELEDWVPAVLTSGVASSTPGAWACRVLPTGERGIVAEGANQSLVALIGEYAHVSAARGPLGYAEPFALSARDSRLYAIAPGPRGLERTPLGDETPLDSLAAGSASDSALGVFALSTGKKLYHVRQESGGPGGWGAFFPLSAELTFERIVDASNPRGFPEAFAVSTAGKLYRVWQDPSDDHWHFELVELARTERVEEFSAYSVQLTIFDAAQLPAPNTDVVLFSGSPVTLDINGRVAFLDAARPWRGKSNLAGQITFSRRTDALGVPMLEVWTAFMAQGDRVYIDATAPLQERLGMLDAKGLLDATWEDSAGQQVQLLQGSANRDPELVKHLADALQVTLSLAPGVPPSGAARAAAAPARSLPEHSEVVLGTDGPRVRSLGPAQLEALVAGYRALPSLSSFMGLELSWGGLFNAIEQGIVRIASYAVSAERGVWSGVKVLFKLIVKGRDYLYEALITTADQALDLVEEVFSTVSVTFEKLFRWLGVIFNWQDILRTKRVLQYGLEQIFLFLRDAIPALQSRITGSIGGLKAQAQRAFQSARERLLAKSSILELSGRAPPLSGAGMAVEHNLLWTAFVDRMDMTPALPIADDPRLHATRDELLKLAQGLIGSQQFMDAKKFAADSMTSIDDFARQSLSALLGVLEGLSKLGLDAANQVITLMLRAVEWILADVRKVLEAEWNVPFIKELYTHVTGGGRLSVSDLGALLVAVPVNVFYKSQYKVAPFPDEPSVTKFQEAFTAQKLLQASGLGPKVERDAPANGMTGSQVLDFDRFLNITAALAGFYEGLGTTILDGLALRKAAGNDTATKVISWGVHVPSWISFLASFPWRPSQKLSWTCTTRDDIKLWDWIVQLVALVVDGAFLAWEGSIARSSSEDTGPFLESGFGVIEAVLAFVGYSKADHVDPLEVAGDTLGWLPTALAFARTKAVNILFRSVPLRVLIVTESVCVISGTVISLHEATRP